MTAILAIKHIQSLRTPTEKLKALEENKDIPYLKELLKVAFDSRVVTNINTIPPITKNGTYKERGSEFLSLVRFLEHTPKSNESIRKVTEFLEQCSPVEQEIYGQIMTKALRIGLQAKRINTVYPGLIALFDVMKADSYKNVTIKYPILCEEKLDGVRCVVIVEHGELTAKTRNGLSLNLPNIFSALSKRLRETGWDNIILDGELINRESRTATMSAVNRILKGDGTDEALTFFIYDTVPLVDFFTQSRCKIPLNERKLYLKSFGGNNKYYKIHEGVILGDEIMLETQLRKVKQAGGEGLVLKPLDGVYEYKRSKHWIKVKLKFTLRAQVVGVTEGRGKYKGQIGALTVKLRGEDWTFNVSSGLTDADRREFSAEPNKILDKIITVGFNDIQQTQNGETFFDFCTYEGIEETGMDADTLTDVYREVKSGGKIV